MPLGVEPSQAEMIAYPSAMDNCLAAQLCLVSGFCGGVPNSRHVPGTAADITIPDIGFERAREPVESVDFDGTGFYPPLNAGAVRGLSMT